jgi:tRNA (guanine-N7-)-methyltransferase
VSVRKGVRLPLEQLQPYLVPFPQPGQQLEFAALFANDHPVELEVGFGKGSFLVAAAPLHPERNYLGIEIDRALQLYVANRIVKRQLRQVKLLCGDGARLLAEHLRPHSLAAVHVYFPDPWWKKRHQKRRVFSERFALDCARVLKPGGHLYLATDVAEYFQIMLGILAQRPEFTPLRAERVEAIQDAESPQTNFEKKAYLQGRPVWRADFRRLEP